VSGYRLAALDESRFSEVHRTFVAAFSDYAVDLSAFTEPLLRARAIKNGVDFSACVGAFDDEDALVGFTLVGLDTWKGESAAYDIMTGIVPRARGQGVARAMFEFVRPRLRARGIVRFVLEVLKQNEPAIRAYRKVGFTISREFACFELSLDAESPRPNRSRSEPTFDAFEPTGRDILDAFEDALDWTPSWEQTFSALRRVPDQLELHVARVDGRPAGLLAYYPGSQRIFTLVVRPEHRRRGIARSLVEHLVSGLPEEVRSIRAIDVDAADAGMIALLSELGFGSLPRQYEMETAL
jgi:ribosomal protein S18 acetylase RimI-like enzyme